MAEKSSSNSRDHWGFVWYAIIVIAWFTDAMLRARFGRYDASREVYVYSTIHWRVLATVWLLTAVTLSVIALWRPSLDPPHRLVERSAPPLFLFAAAVDWLESLGMHTWKLVIPIVVAYGLLIAWKAKRLRVQSIPATAEQ